MSENKQYAERDLMGMDMAGNHYCRHISAMTREGLDSKSDIAAELGWRDMQIVDLNQENAAAMNSIRNAEEILKAAGIESETLQAGVMALVDRMNAVVAENSALKSAINSAVHHWASAELGSMAGSMDNCMPLCRDVINATPATDAILNALRAEIFSEVPRVGDGKEQSAFESFAESKGLDLSMHPLHYLFLDGKTNLVRSTWRECLVYVAAQLRAGDADKIGI